MQLANKFLKALIQSADFDSWALFQKNYLPEKYHDVVDAIDRYVQEKHELPTEEFLLKDGIRDTHLHSKFKAIWKSEDTELPCSTLLDILRNEYVQKLILGKLEKYLNDSIAFESAQESLESLHKIIIDVESRVNLRDLNADMQYIKLFEEQSQLDRYISLGLNAEYDNEMLFSPTDYILIGGKRGSGKSLTCSNIAHHVVEEKKQSAIYFTIEMPARSILQRAASIATGVSHAKLRRRNLEQEDMEIVAQWWANRFEGGEEVFHQYKNEWTARCFDKLHKVLASQYELKEPRLEVVYDPVLSIATIDAEVQKFVERVKNPGIIIVDYINQVKRPVTRGNQYDWTEQIEISKWLKALAQRYEIPVLTPYQIDKTGEARFAKGILDSADASFILDPGEKNDNAMKFECVKMRDGLDDVSFKSVVDWNSLKIGPDSAPEKQEETIQTPENTDDDLR